MTINRIALPTENYEPYYRTLRAFTRVVDENLASIARIASLIDTQLSYPDIPVSSPGASPNGDLKDRVNEGSFKAENERNPNIGGSGYDHELATEGFNEIKATTKMNEIYNETKESEGSMNVTEGPDYLREYLDNELCVGLIPAELPTKGLMQNEKARQLLVDNYRLARMKQLKLQKNKVLLQVLQTYEALMTQVIIPRLSEEVMGLNLLTIKDIKESILPERISKELSIWSMYLGYTTYLDKILRQVHSLTVLLAQHTDLLEANRLGAELSILEKLLTLAKESDT